MAKKIAVAAEVLRNEQIGLGIFSMMLKAPELAEAAHPGQFLSVYLNDGAHLLPRPISICGADPETGLVRIVYMVMGVGTGKLSETHSGAKVKLAGPLGNGFNTSLDGEIAVVGGGVGAPPLLFLTKRLLERQKSVTVYLGFRSLAYLYDEFEALGAKVRVATDDGSHGFHGTVTALMAEQGAKPGVIYACGPKPMLQAVSAYAKDCGAACQASMEEMMACGMGACMGCVIKIRDEQDSKGWHYERVCHEGPVFDGKAVLWHA